MAKFKLMKSDAINVMIKSISKRGKQLDHDIQRTACSIVNHVNQYHEVSLANNLIAAMPKGSRINALKDWFNDHLKGNCFNQETQLFEQSPQGTELSDMDAVLKAKPWYEHKAEKGFVPTDHTAVMAALLKKMNSDLSQTDAEKIAKVKATPQALKILTDACILLGMDVAPAPAPEVVDPLSALV